MCVAFCLSSFYSSSLYLGRPFGFCCCPQRLLDQEVGFYDQTKIGEITSRLSTDTTKMADQISLNFNVLLRSVITAIGVMYFMFSTSWKLTVLTVVSVPSSVVISKVYGSYYRQLTKETQKTLAGANSVAEEMLSSMSTLRGFGAEHTEKSLYIEHLRDFMAVNVRQVGDLLGWLICRVVFGLAFVVLMR